MIWIAEFNLSRSTNPCPSNSDQPVHGYFQVSMFFHPDIPITPFRFPSGFFQPQDRSAFPHSLPGGVNLLGRPGERIKTGARGHVPLRKTAKKPCWFFPALVKTSIQESLDDQRCLSRPPITGLRSFFSRFRYWLWRFRSLGFLPRLLPRYTTGSGAAPCTVE